MLAKKVTPILNVSDMRESFEWFEKLGWKKAWDWGDPPDFGAVCSGECEIFLCENGQGGRGRGYSKTFGPEGDQSSDKGVWLCILVDDVDAVTSTAWLKDSKSRGLLPTRRGACERCT